MAFERPHVTAERSLDAPHLKFDLPALLAEMKTEEAWQRESHTAMTLLKTPHLRVVLVAMRAGTVLPMHRADGALTIHVIAGDLWLRTDDHAAALGPGHLLALEPSTPHAVEARADSAFLLTLSTELAHPAERRRASGRLRAAQAYNPS
jgi:quercetin dioxygenase-like cupin family protein